MYNENYNVKLEEAKAMSIYKFKKDMGLSELKQQLENGTFNFTNNVPFVLEFGNIDIELTILNNDNGYDLGYYVCVKGTSVDELDDGWDSFDYSDTKVDLNVSNIEEFMFNDLIKFAEKHNLYWSQLND